MQRSYFTLSILILASLLVSCANLQPQEVRALEGYRMPTDVPAPTALTQTAESEIASKIPPTDCPVTVPQDPAFTPPSPYDSLGFEGEFWFGSDSLWTAIRQDGIWYSLPHNPEGYTQKVFWWREGYVWTEEPQPDLNVTGERLDAFAPPLIASKATNAYAGDIGSAMLVGVDVPTLGCWKVTGKYKDAELSFVVWVAP